jgi:predicted nuclease with TOPRIM domain
MIKILDYIFKILGVVFLVVMLGALFGFYDISITNEDPNNHLKEKIDSLKKEKEIYQDSITKLNIKITETDTLLEDYAKKDSVLKDSLLIIKSKYYEAINMLNNFDNPEHYEFFTRYLDSVDYTGR